MVTQIVTVELVGMYALGVKRLLEVGICSDNGLQSTVPV